MVMVFLELLLQFFDKILKDYGMSYCDVEFGIRDGLIFRGWLVEELVDKFVVMIYFGYCVN